jgi:predicted NAD/FAD-binding protein
MKKNLAIIGGGIAGLTAAYALKDRHAVTLFERSGRLGGNAYTFTTPDGEEADIAAAVFGARSCPAVLKLFRSLDIGTVRAFRIGPCGASGPGVGYYDLDSKQGLFFTPRLSGLLAQRFEILRPRHIMSVLRLMQGMEQARSLLQQGGLEGLSLAEALPMFPALQGDAKLMFLSNLCLLSSMHCEDVLAAPAGFFVNKLTTHSDLFPPTPRTLCSIRFVRNGTKSYVRALSNPYRDSIVLNARIRAVRRPAGHVLVLMDDGREQRFDNVVFACNADQALALLEEPTPDERRLLGAWRYTEGRVVVHRDHASFPERKLIEGYTFLYRRAGSCIDTSVSGSLWALPYVSRASGLISTQHPNFPIAPELTLLEKVFRTPRFDLASCATIRDLPSLNGVRNSYYCGSHFGFGLHEDAVASALEVARRLQGEF